MAERRRAPRQMMTGQVTLKGEQQQITGELINVSEAGVGLYAGAAAKPGSNWVVEINLNNNQGKPTGVFALPAILVRQIHTGEGLYWGLAASGLTWEQRQRWERLLESRQREA